MTEADERILYTSHVKQNGRGLFNLFHSAGPYKEIFRFSHYLLEGQCLDTTTYGSVLVCRLNITTLQRTNSLVRNISHLNSNCSEFVYSLLLCYQIIKVFILRNIYWRMNIFRIRTTDGIVIQMLIQPSITLSLLKHIMFEYTFAFRLAFSSGENIKRGARVH